MIIELFGLQGSGKSTAYRLFNENQETSNIKTLSLLSERYYEHFLIYKIGKSVSKKFALRALRVLSPIFNVIKLKHFLKNKKNIRQFKFRILHSRLFENKKEARIFFRRIRYRIILSSIINTKYSKSIILCDEGYLQLLLMFARDVEDFKNFSFDLDGIIFVNVSSKQSVRRQIARDELDVHNNFSFEKFSNIMKEREERVNKIIDYYGKNKIYIVDNENRILNKELVKSIDDFFGNNANV